MLKELKTFYHLEEFVPSLREQFERHSIDDKKFVRVAVQARKTAQGFVPAIPNRREIYLTDDKASCFWEVESLHSLFRGNQQPPVIGDYPQVYHESFCLLDLHALEICQIGGDLLDAEMKEIYSALRRRPDGKSMGVAHDYMWQAAALVLGSRPLSQAEFEAIMARLERSCRTFEIGAGSRNYVTTLRRTFGQETLRTRL